jgi:hypothetical protein
MFLKVTDKNVKNAPKRDGTTQMNLKNMVSKRNLSQRTTCYMIPII